MAKRTCSVDGCERDHYGRGWCRYHYNIEYKRGLPPLPKPTAMERFWAKVDKAESGCWVWTGHTHVGYGRFRFDGDTRSAHRVAYTVLVGPIPEGLELDHLCRNPPCVNPSHLEPVTQPQHARRSLKATKTHCVHGHEYTPENTIRKPGGTRRCRTCYLDYQRRLRLRKKALGLKV